MSLRVEATVVSVPAGAVIAVGGAVILVGAALAYSAGRGLVVCGQAVKRVFEERARRQRELYELCNQYEKRLRKGVIEGLKEEAYDRRLKKKAIPRKQTEAVAMPSSEPASPIGESELVWLEEWSQEEAEVFTASDLDSQLNDLNKDIGTLRGQLVELKDIGAAGPYWNDLRKEVEELASDLRLVTENIRLEEGESPGITLSEISLRLVMARNDVWRLRHSLESHNRLRERTIELIEKSEEELRKLKSNSHLTTGSELEVAEWGLDRAEELFNRGEFEYALEQAEGVLHVVEQLQTTHDVRRIVLTETLHELDRFLEDIGIPVDHPNTRTLISKALELVGGTEADKDEAWALLERAHRAAEVFVEEQAIEIMLAQQQALVRISREAMQAVGFSPIPEPETIALGEEQHIMGKDEYGRRLHVWLNHEGKLGVKTEGFGDASCKEVTEKFFRELWDRDVITRGAIVTSLQDTATTLIEVLLRKGFTIVEETQDENGATIVAIRNTEEAIEYRVDYDGEATLVKKEIPEPILPDAEEIAEDVNSCLEEHRQRQGIYVQRRLQQRQRIKG